MPPKRKSRDFSEPVVGDSVERVQVTLLDLAHRIERIRSNYEQYRSRAALHIMSPPEKNERKERIRASIEIVEEQCKGFARNRGAEADFRLGLKYARRHYGMKPRRKRFGYYVTRTISEMERFLEAERLLLNVDQPPFNWLEAFWTEIEQREDEARSAKRELARKGQRTGDEK